MKYKRSSIQLIRSSVAIDNGLTAATRLKQLKVTIINVALFVCLFWIAVDYLPLACTTVHLNIPTKYMCTHQAVISVWRHRCHLCKYDNGERQKKVLDFDYYYRHSYLPFFGYCYTVLYRKSFNMTKAKHRLLSH